MIMMFDSLKMHILGSALYVDVCIWNASKKEFNSIFLTFDTGATVTTISHEALNALGYDTSKGMERMITTGSGVAAVREITVEKLKLGINYTLDDVMVYAHDFPDESFSIGVIGLNVLSQFDIFLRFSGKTINLYKIP